MVLIRNISEWVKIYEKPLTSSNKECEHSMNFDFFLLDGKYKVENTH